MPTVSSRTRRAPTTPSSVRRTAQTRSESPSVTPGRHPGVPLVVTENGIATADDTRRIAYTSGALDAPRRRDGRRRRRPRLPALERPRQLRMGALGTDIRADRRRPGQLCTAPEAEPRVARRTGPAWSAVVVGPKELTEFVTILSDYESDLQSNRELSRDSSADQHHEPVRWRPPARLLWAPRPAQRSEWPRRVE